MVQKPVFVRTAAEVEADGATTTGQTAGMQRKAAIVKKCSGLCASVMTAAAHTSSAIHHHGEQDTIIYAAAGHGGAILSDDGATRQELAPGDFALVPAWTEHQEVNDGDGEVTWVVTRSGPEPVVVNLEGWAGQLKKKGEKEREDEEKQAEADKKAAEREQAGAVAP